MLTIAYNLLSVKLEIIMRQVGEKIHAFEKMERKI
jgi:hypothetical protein